MSWIMQRKYIRILCLNICFLATMLHHGTTLSNPSDEAKLVEKLLTGYTKAVRPAENSLNPLHVDFNVRVIQVIDFNEKYQVLTWNLWVRQSWMDYRLKWNQSEFRLDRLVLNPFWLWVPDIYLYNNAQEQYHGFDYDTQDGVVVTSDGKVVWYTQTIMKSTCKFAVRYFPFDEQRCELEFGSWTHSGAQLNLSLLANKGDISAATENGEWALIDFNAVRNVVYYKCCPEPYPSVTFTLTARRRSNFYLSNFMLPCVLIAFISALAFFLPYKSGERVNFLITSLLSLTIFFLMISDMIPSTPDGTPLFSQFMIAILIEISIAVTVVCMIINIESKTSPPTSLVCRFLNKYLPGLVCLPPHNVVHYDHDVNWRLGEMSIGYGSNTEIISNETSQGIATVLNGHLDVLSVDEDEVDPNLLTSYSDHFKDKMLQVLEGIACSSIEKLQRAEIVKERLMLASKMDRFLHAFFTVLVLFTVVVVLSIPPELNL